MLTTASSTVPELSIAMTAIRDLLADTVPSVDPLDTVTEMAVDTVRVLTVPLDNVELRKSNTVGFSVTVNAFVATDAVIG